MRAETVTEITSIRIEMSLGEAKVLQEILRNVKERETSKLWYNVAFVLEDVLSACLNMYEKI